MVEAASKQTNNDSYSNAPQGHGDSTGEPSQKPKHQMVCEALQEYAKVYLDPGQNVFYSARSYPFRLDSIPKSRRFPLDRRSNNIQAELTELNQKQKQPPKLRSETAAAAKLPAAS